MLQLKFVLLYVNHVRLNTEICSTKKYKYFSYFSTKKQQQTYIFCGYSLELPQWDTFNEYPSTCFPGEETKIYIWAQLFKTNDVII